MSLCGGLKALVVIGSALAGCIADTVNQIVKVCHLVQQGGRGVLNRAVQCCGGNIDLIPLPGEGILHHAEGVDLIPANIELAGLEVALVNSMNREKMLKQVLDGAKREYDYILLDCTPSLGMLTINALAAADTALIPVQAQYLSAKGLEQLLQTICKVHRQKINPKLKIEGILLTMTDSRTNYGKQIDTLIRQAYGSKIKVFDQTIPRSVRAAETSAAGKSIFQYDPKSKVAEAYQSLAKTNY